MKHWTQTREGRKRQSDIQKARWAKIKQSGATPPHDELDEFKLMGEVLQLFDKLPQRGKDYIRQRIA